MIFLTSLENLVKASGTRPENFKEVVDKPENSLKYPKEVILRRGKQKKKSRLRRENLVQKVNLYGQKIIYIA